MADDGASSPKRVRLDVDPDPPPGPAIDSADDPSSTLTAADPEKESSALTLFAARLRSQIRRQPQTDVEAACRKHLAWSATNTIAVARSTRITLVHVLAPSRVAHIPTPLKANSISFSPRGDALLACFPGNLVLLWTAEKGTLNEWSLRGEWRQIEGRILDVQWLSSRRRWLTTPNNNHRESAKGPMVVDEPYGAAAILVSDAGQLTVVQGDIRSRTGPFQLTQHKLPLPSYLRLQHSAISLVPDEPSAIVAFTTRLSSKANVSDIAGAGHALGMFFDDGEATDEVEDVAPPSDGQDKIELAELRFFLDKDDEVDSAIYSRPLLPIFTASFANQFTPFTGSMTQMMWLDDVPKVKDEGTSLQLFASFYDDGVTTVRVWIIKREDINKLSEAFSKLESAKDVKANEEDEDWIAQEMHDARFEEHILSDFVRCASASGSRRLLSCVSPSMRATALQDVPALSLTYQMFDCDTMSLLTHDQVHVPKNFTSSIRRLAVSPHGRLAAGIHQSKIVITAIGGVDDEDTTCLRNALLQDNDISDLVHGRFSNIKSVGYSLDLGAKTTMAHILPLIRLQAQQTKNAQTRRASLAILELTNSFRIISMSEQDNGQGFKFASLWTMASQLEWTLVLLTTTARQAFLLDERLQADEEKAESTTSVSAYASADEPDLLSVFSQSVPRTLLVRNIMKLIAFCNWLDLIVEGGGGNLKDVYKVYSIRSTHNAPLEEKALSASKIANSLALCHSKVRELLLQCAMDLSQTGRFFKSYNDERAAAAAVASADELEPWYAGTTAPIESRRSLSRAMLTSNSVRTMLYIFSPQTDWTMPILGREGMSKDAENLDAVNGGVMITPSVQRRDALTKAPMTLSSERRVCLTCKAETQLNVDEGPRCICGARTWWNTVH